MIIDKEVYTEPEAQQLFEYLDTLEVEYHKQYKRFNQMVLRTMVIGLSILAKLTRTLVVMLL